MNPWEQFRSQAGSSGIPDIDSFRQRLQAFNQQDRARTKENKKYSKQVQSFKKTFYGGINEDVKPQILKSLRRRAEEGDELARRQYNAIISDPRIKKRTQETFDVKLNPFERAVDIGADVAGAVVQPVERIATGVARALPGGTADLEAAQQGVQQQQAFTQRIAQKLQDKNLTKVQRTRYRELLDRTLKDEEPAQALLEVSRKIKDETDRSAFIGALVGTASTFVPVAKAAQVARGGLQAAKAVAPGVAAGAVGGAGYVASEDPEASAGELALGAGVGAAAGAALPLAGAGVSRLRNVAQTRKYNKLRANAITDESRLLPETGSQGAPVAPESRQLGTGAIDETLAVPSGASPELTKRLKQVDAKIRDAQVNGNITAAEARALVAERRSLVQQIQNPLAKYELDNITNPPLREAAERVVTQAEESTAPRVKPGQLPAPAGRGTFEQKQLEKLAGADIPKAPRAKSQAGPNTPRLSQRTEQAAIKRELTEGFDDLPEFERMNLQQQADAVAEVVTKDYEAAKKIAMGEIAPPPGVTAERFYIGVQHKALLDGDAKTLKDLALSKTATAATRKGQEIASLRGTDAENPLTAFKLILKARKDSALKIPRTISDEEAEQITTLARDVALKKEAYLNGGDRLAYGKARVAYDNYVEALREAANKKTLTEALKHPGETVTEVAGVTKSLRASLDNSVLLRQGWKALFTHPRTWAKNSIKSFDDIVKTIGGREVMNDVRADVYSRPNFVNGLYEKMGLDVGRIVEEAFPSVSPEKIPVLGRAFKASEAAFTAWQQRTRADLADKYLEIAAKTGVDLTSKKELQSIGKLVNSLTSRGDLGRTGEKSSQFLNNLLFSPRLLKSNIDVLTAHQFQRDVSPFVRRQAAINLLKIAAGTAMILKLADEVRPESVDWDPRSSNFGKIRVGNTRFDVSGNMGGLVTLGSRLATASTKSSTTGEVTPLNTGEFGGQTTFDVLLSFGENKLSPAAAVVRDYLKGQDFEGDPVTPLSTVKNLTLPLIAANYFEVKNTPNSAPAIAVLIADGLGISANSYAPRSNWSKNSGKELTAFKRKVGNDKFKEANKKFNDRYVKWFDEIRKDARFYKLSQEDRLGLITAKKKALKDEVLQSYGYEYKRRERTQETENLIEALKQY